MPSNEATATSLFSSVYDIGITCFDKCFFFYVICGRQNFLWKFILTSRVFLTDMPAFLEKCALKDIRILSTSTITVQWWYQSSKGLYLLNFLNWSDFLITFRDCSRFFYKNDFFNQLKTMKFFEYKIFFCAASSCFCRRELLFFVQHHFFFDIKHFFVQHQLVFVDIILFFVQHQPFFSTQSYFLNNTKFLFQTLFRVSCHGDILLLSRSKRSIITCQKNHKVSLLCDTKELCFCVSQFFYIKFLYCTFAACWFSS